ncbi:MAG: pilus assembly protein [Chlorobaculum sp.]|nr:pilus assembly protein [Chlorobaculum sp.]
MSTVIDIRQTSKKESARSQKGNAVLEFALILPVLVALSFGMINFSLALYDLTVLTMASRSAARAGALYVTGRTNANIISRAEIAARDNSNNLKDFGSGSINPTITPNANPIAENKIAVTVTFNFRVLPVILNIFPFVPPEIPLSARTSMNLEGGP